MTDELLLCPFCGSGDLNIVGDTPSLAPMGSRVRCSGCGASGPWVSDDYAGAYWNRRAPAPVQPPTPEPDDLIARLWEWANSERRDDSRHYDGFSSAQLIADELRAAGGLPTRHDAGFAAAQSEVRELLKPRIR